MARQIVFDALQDGVPTAGDLLDRLGSLEPAQRRQLLDHARQGCGLDPIADVEAGMRAEIASRAGAVVAAQYNRTQMCHGRTPAGAPCNAIPLVNGVPATVNERRWHCAEHRSQATPEDLSPLPSPWAYSPSGAIIEIDPAEAARIGEAAASRARREQARLADAAAEAERVREHQAAIDAQLQQELPRHLRAA